MIYLLDTNTCIRLLNEDRNSAVSRRLAMMQSGDVTICSVVKAELYWGAFRSSRQDSNLARLERFFTEFVSLPFDDQSAIIYGQIRAGLAASGTPIGPNDLLIASIALANNLIVVTHNTREFIRVQGLRLEDWEIEA
ncbi:type II toxin-antitoxin system VapC family toxin [Microcoleus sp. herbarium7]|uniref:type II toxin-antitoxin system tRNA(fMet)-specific endonuclease VapC n=1 Tax=Microcoleus sp. herbarium7 TaxID=3055435 RepID=UPI002FD2E8B7